MRILLFLSALFLSAAAAARDIVVVQVVAYSGPYAETSRDLVGGAKTCFDLVNSQGGVNGNRIRHKAVDGGATADSQRAKLREMLQEEADVLFGFVGDEAVAVAAAEPQLKGGQIALVGPVAGRLAAFPGVFYVRPSYQAEIRQIVSYFRSFQFTRFAIVKEPAAYDRGIGEAVEQELAAQKLRPAVSLTLSSADRIADADINAVLKASPQALILLTDSIGTAEFIKRYKPRAPGVMAVGLSTLNPQVIFELLGPQLASGTMITQVVPNPGQGSSPLTREYIAALRKFRDEPPSNVSFEGFIAAKALVAALKSSGRAPDRASILATLRKLPPVNLDGVVVDFAQDGRDRAAVEMSMIRKSGALLF